MRKSVYKNDADKMGEQIAVFDECIAEMSEEGREGLTLLTAYVAEQLHKGGGIGSAKALIIQTLRFLLDAENK